MFRPLRAVLLAGITALAVVTAGCSAGSPPRTQPSPTPSTPSAHNGPDAYAACMRTHDVPEFPDPGPSGLLYIGPRDTFDTDSPQYLAAYEACQQLA